MPAQHKKRGGVGSARRWASVFMVLLGLLTLLSQPVLAQSLRFSVPRSTADVYVNEDGTVTVDYLYVFDNQPNFDPIDAVDVGVPTNSYELSSVSATIDGQPVSSIETSPYVNPGVAINLASRAIQPGQSGEVRVRIGVIKRMLFKASAQEAEPYASFNFQPNYFGSDFVTGQTDMTVTLYLPPGLTADEPRYFRPENWPGSETPESGFDQQGRVFYRWHAANASSSAKYTFGASFPARLVPAEAVLTEVPAVGGLSSNTLCIGLFCLGFAGFLGITIFSSIAGNKKRKLQYLPPRVAVEGNGIKRGLTAVEAAILMQQPMDKILTMILFAVIKKGAARVTSQNPLKLEILQPQPADLRSYEKDFVAAMGQATVANQRRGLQEMMTNLVKGVSEKMRGFSRKETVTYYQNIMTKAWQQVEQANTPEMKMQSFDDAMDWTMLDRRFNDRTREVFGPQPVFVPTWWGRFDPGYGGGSVFTSTGGQAPAQPTFDTSGNRPPQGVSLPNLPGADFAASMAAGMQSFASNVVGDLTAFTGGVTSKTNPPPPPSPARSSGRGGGGGSCACACACAGCACACAGGGR